MGISHGANFVCLESFPLYIYLSLGFLGLGSFGPIL